MSRASPKSRWNQAALSWSPRGHPGRARRGPVEEELAEVEEARCRRGDRNPAKAADLLAPSRRDLSDHLKPVTPEQPDMAEVISFRQPEGRCRQDDHRPRNLAVALPELGNRVLYRP